MEPFTIAAILLALAAGAGGGAAVQGHKKNKQIVNLQKVISELHKELKKWKDKVAQLMELIDFKNQEIQQIECALMESNHRRMLLVSEIERLHKELKFKKSLFVKAWYFVTFRIGKYKNALIKLYETRNRKEKEQREQEEVYNQLISKKEKNLILLNHIEIEIDTATKNQNEIEDKLSGIKHAS